MHDVLRQVKQYLLSGVSFVIPFVACGGILIAIAIAGAPMGPTGPDFSGSPILRGLMEIGTAAFALVVPVLAGYIAFGMVDRPGLVPGFVGGAIAHSLGAGFLGGLVAGLLAGGTVMAIKTIPVHRLVRPVMPILIIPIVASVVVGGLLYGVIGGPIREVMTALGQGLQVLGTGNQVVLAAILGAMIAFDMGGPVNKAAFFFGAAMIKEGNVVVMGAVAAAIGIPPLGVGLATLIRRHTWSDTERESGLAALAMGSIGITEGAIPFAAADPLRVIPAIMAGSAVAAVLAMLLGAGNHAPHGGLIVLPVIDHRLGYLLAVAAGVLTTAGLLTVLRTCTTRASTSE